MNNKNMQLCGIGNGIVDIQYKISDEFFNSLNLAKSEMRLIEQNELVQLLNKIIKSTENSSNNKFSYNKCSGGSATNTIDAFAQFGISKFADFDGKAAYLTAVGNDENGNFYYSELENSKIKYKKNFIENSQTGICLVLITPDGERTMLTYLGASKNFAIENLDENLISQAEWLYLEGYKFSETDGISSITKAIEIAKKNQTKIAITASDLFIIEVFNEQLIAAMSQADLFFCNENEAKSVAKFIKKNEKIRQNHQEISDFDEKNSDDAIKIISQICPNVVMTKGEKGAKIFFENEFYEFNSFKIKVIDTTGAGDMFAGAFLFGLLNGEKIINSSEKSEIINFAGKLASKASALVVSQFGARYSGDFQKIIDEIK
jgi:sugar/nucleoside kinase (ribokinase family)